MDKIVDMANRRNAIVLDCRFSPYSPYHGWLKKAFQTALGDRYIWVRGFGNVNYKSGGSVRLYDEAEGLKVVATLGKASKDGKPIIDAIALMCACADVSTCHRRHVSYVVNDFLGWPVYHLTAQDIMGTSEKPPSEATLRKREREAAKKQQTSLFGDEPGKRFRHRDDS